MPADKGARQDPAEVAGAHEVDTRTIAPAAATSNPAALDLAASTCADLLGRLGLNADEAGALFGVSGRAWRKWDAAERVPQPYRLGARGMRRWDPRELAAWAAAGAPNRARWEAVRQAQEARRG
jgi:hypothetical protein